MLRRTLLASIGCFPALAAAPGKGWKAFGEWKSEGGKPQQWTIGADELSNGPNGKVNNIYTAEKFGDLEVWVEFQVPKGSNSGVYLHGLYEVQIFDSFGKAQITTQDSGSIYHRWIDNNPVGGSVAKVNAAKGPGEWQEFHIRFRAPKFDGAGKKTANARFEWVNYNGQLVQENAECEGPTRAHMEIAEAARNPLMLQGDHGPVRFRNLRYRAI
jgi:hypothetical protein